MQAGRRATDHARMGKGGNMTMDESVALTQ